MSRITLAASILALGLAALALVRGGARSDPVADERLARLAAELDEHVATIHATPPSQAELAALEARVADLERSPQRSPAPAAIPVAAAAPLAAASATDAERGGPSPAERAELEDLLERLIGADYDLHGSDEDIQRFFELARGSEALAGIVAELEGRVGAHPGDLEARMELADAYVAKILTMAHGPEQGVWGAKAEEQWREVTAQDPEHWGAHFALGNNFSYYPDVMGKTGEAIRYLEQARAIQERGAPLVEHVQTYLSLARLYVRDGARDEALAVLEAGLASHPGNAALLAELERLEGG